MLKHDGLLDHGLVWLGEEVVLFDSIGTCDLRQISLQQMGFSSSSLGGAGVDVLVVDSRELLGSALLD